MIESTIRLVITNIPLILFVLALLIAAMTSRSASSKAEHYLAWLLLLSIGVDTLWAGLYHVFAPQTAAAFIGWQDSPFQFEIGVADIASGVMAIVSFWRSLDFKLAVVIYAVIFYVGVVYGHIHEAVVAGNFAPGNVGIMLLLSISKPILLVGLVLAAKRHSRSVR
jgi:hypothetical protein